MTDLLQQLRNLSPAKRELLSRKLQGHAVTKPLAAIARTGRKRFPLSPAQERIWFLQQLVPESAAYHCPLALRIAGDLDLQVLRRAFDEIRRRHEILRTTLVPGPSRVEQVVAPAAPVAVRIIDVDKDHGGGDAMERLAAEARRPFDLNRGPLFRVSVLRLADREHILLVNMHHLISDGWSIGLLLRELTTLYDAFSSGRLAPLPELPIQYGDFALWQRQQLQQGGFDHLLSYWREQLAGAPAGLALPADRTRPAVQSLNGLTRSFAIAPSAADGLDTISRQHGATLFITLLAVFQSWLWRITRQDDIIVGSPIANRPHVETQNLIGLFLNTLPMRARFSTDSTFRNVLDHVRQTAIDAYAHQDLPFEKLVEDLRPQRDLSRTPLFQTMFVLHPDRRKEQVSGLAVSTPLEFESGTAQFDLSLIMGRTEQGLLGTLEYNADLFFPATTDRMTASFETFLAGVTADPGRRVADVPLLSPHDRDRLLVHCNSTHRDYPDDATVVDSFERQAERTPDTVAVRTPDGEFTYRDLRSFARGLAARLRQRGACPETTVGVFVDRGLNMAVALLGILEAGAAYVPLDPSAPQNRLRNMLADAAVGVVVSEQALAARAADLGGDVLLVDATGSWISEERSSDGAIVAPDNAAYVIFTSGSTGKPKPIVVPHRALANHMLSIGRRFELGTTDRVLQFAPVAFDVAAEELFPAWANGATVVVPPPGLSTSLAAFTDFVLRERITVLNLPTPYWHAWALDLKRRGAVPPPTLRLLVVGSDKASPDRLSLWRELTRDHVRWMNAYGVTEATITSTLYEPTEGEQPATTVPIGRPIENVRAYVLDPSLEPVPVGVPGELYLAGRGLARGYLNSPDLTADRFIPHRFGAEPGERLYRTGDRARYRTDGNIELLGRVDQQVKIRGFRLEPGEIEATLKQHASVREAVVVARAIQREYGGADAGFDTADTQLVAYVVPHHRETFSRHTLREFLSERLPAYMLPTRIVILDALPTNANGKLDPSALPDPGPAAERPADRLPPETDAERAIAAIWRDVLRLDGVSANDNFFDVGGNSLSMLDVQRRIEKLFGQTLPVLAMFKHPTVESMACYLTAWREESKVASPGRDRAEIRRSRLARSGRGVI